jgi:hypothetical protein
LEKAAPRLKERMGHFPEGFSDLVQSGYSRGFPVGLTEAPYLLDPQSGEVYISADTKLPIPAKQQRPILL